jgi:hypothetical protein
MNGIIWLASYFKSGNTWFRVFLTNLLQEADAPVSINELHSTPIASARDIFDAYVGVQSSDLTVDEIDRLRPELYIQLAEDTDKPLFMKVHDAWTFVDDENPLFPEGATSGVIYFIRNPLDVAVSLAHHSGVDYNKIISYMSDPTYSSGHKSDRLHSQLRQKLLSWSAHVLSWTASVPFPVCVLRYEDMKTHPLQTFERAVRFANLHHSGAQIQQALEFSAFDELQRQEAAQGFKEKSPACERFFRVGRIGAWQTQLSEEQAQRIVNDHREVMRRFGYLDRNDRIVY